MNRLSAARRTIARIWRRLRGERKSRARLASAVALGLFIGCLPVYGLHFVLCLLVCLPFGLDLLVAYLAANISNPLIAPFLVTLEVEVGSLLTTGQHAAFTLARAKETGFFGFVWQAGVGSVFVGGALAAIGGGLAYAVAQPGSASDGIDDEEALVEAAVLRTIERYAQAPIGDRYQIAGKLRWDPLTKMLAALPHDLGRVLDVGAGRGQFGLLLVELGACTSLFGFDGDPRKVDAARSAGGSARFEVRDLLDFPPDPADTVLLFDVLHYLPFAEQDQLLREVGGRVVRGRILIRELDAARGARSAVTRGGEWLARLLGLHRGRSGRHYRPATQLVGALSELGFSCQVRGASEGTPFGNVLIIATR